MEYWAKKYNDTIVDPLELKLKADKLMEEYDKRIEMEQKKRKKAGVPDEDGWVTVAPKAGKKKINNDKKILKKMEKKRKQREEAAGNVPIAYQYKNQSQHKKFENLSKLRQKFEEDKQRLAQAKAGRKFKPY